MWNAKFVAKLILGVVWNIAIFGGLLFGLAGTLHWARAWWFLAVALVVSAISMATVFPGNQDLLRERFKPPIQKGQPLADRILVMALLVAFLILVAFIPIDVFRLHLLPRPAPLISSLGLVLFVVGASCHWR